MLWTSLKDGILKLTLVDEKGRLDHHTLNYYPYPSHAKSKKGSHDRNISEMYGTAKMFIFPSDMNFFTPMTIVKSRPQGVGLFWFISLYPIPGQSWQF